jgi:hypothetical protein
MSRRRLPLLWLPLGLLLWIAALAGSVAHAASAPGLYDVAVEIADRSPAVRAAALRTALETVLVRLTGLASLPSSPALAAAFGAPDRYAVQFGFDERRVEGEAAPRLLLTVRFADASVRRLLDDAGLPLWSSNRPRIVAWAVADIDGERRLLAADDTHPFAQALIERAAFRGLPLVLPVLDAEEQLDVSTDAVTAGMTDVLVEASARYDADGLVAVRLDPDPSGSLNVQIDLRLRDVDTTNGWRAPSPEAAAVRLVDEVTDALVARYAVAAGGAATLRFDVEGLGAYGDYAGVLTYLGGLEFVDLVQVVEVTGPRLLVDVVTRTPWAQFRDLLDLDGKLVADPDVVPASSTIRLRWQGDGAR